MGTPTDPTGRPPRPAPDGSQDAAPPRADGGADSHEPQESLSDLISGSSSRTRSPGSDIAQMLAHPSAANSDDAPTVITQGPNRAGSATTPHTAPRPPADPPSIAGRRLGHFELIEAIGAGGMAAVLKARDLELGRVVALKILPPEAARDPESVTRFKQEARSAAKLDHENVARVYFCGEDQGLHFIAFEFVEGDNLRVVIDRRGPLPAGECVRYMMQVAAGLSHASERGVVHRDIKPSNILITPDGRAKIVDMGLARYLGSELVNGTVTQSGVTLGTFDYISPEQALDPRRADVRSDIYSLGCAFYHALTGRPPVPEGTAARKLRAHQQDDFLDPRELNPAVPDELAAVLARMVMKDPAARYQTPADLIAHLKALGERLNVGDALAHDPSARAVPADPRGLIAPPRVRPWLALAGVALAVAALAFVIATADPGRAPGPPPHDDPPKETAGAKAAEVPIKGPNPPVRPAPAGRVQTVEELARRLADPATTRVDLAAREFDLRNLPEGVQFRGSDLALVGAPDGGTRLVVVASALPAAAGAPAAAGTLTVKVDGTFAARGIWFDLQHDPDPEKLLPDPVGVRVEEAAKVEFTECVFMPSGGLREHQEPRAVGLGRAADGPAPTLALTRCLFGPGAVAVALPGGSKASATDCGFAPHAAALLFDAPGDGSTASVAKLDRCSFMLDPGTAAVEAAAPADLAVTAADCLFAPVHTRPGPRPLGTGTGADARPGVVARARGERPQVRLAVPAGRTNGFYSVLPVGTAAGPLTFEECRTAPGVTVEDRGRVELRRRPWAETDTDPSATAASDSPWKGFKLLIRTQPALFTAPGPGRPLEPLGVVFRDPDNPRWAWRAYPDERIWPPRQPKAADEFTEKVWYPDPPEGTPAVPGVYTDLKRLLAVARPGDTVVIRHTGPLEVDRVELGSALKAEGDLRVTFKPDAGSAPVLHIKGDVNDQALFKLKSGEVTFENLHFVLKPNRPKGGQTVSAVAVLGGKGCVFRRCVFTLSEEDGSPVAAVHLPDPALQMKMDAGGRAPPAVEFHQCVIRGRGRAVWVEVSRPFNLEVSHSVTALDGPVLLAQSGGEATPFTSHAKFTRTTALVGGPLVEMRGSKAGDPNKPAALGKLEVEADECLFVAVPGAGRPLVDLDGVDPTDWKAVLGWQVRKANRYANFDESAVAGHVRGGDASKEWTWDDWFNHAGEPVSPKGKRFGKVTFAAPPAGLKELAAVRPADLGVKGQEFPDPADAKLPAGADPAELPPVPDEPK